MTLGEKNPTFLSRLNHNSGAIALGSSYQLSRIRVDSMPTRLCLQLLQDCLF